MTKRINPLYFFSKKFATYKSTNNIFIKYTIYTTYFLCFPLRYNSIFIFHTSFITIPYDIKALINIIMKYEKIKSNHNK
ncbi:hypothetical protein PFAG_00492 [Plasmodium falciparum Santa Lucia]|uniref:Uncharacterized protein n=1 Tax=Plasmodium falciparum Santa Lucia TaxID=478859 RepID=W7FWC3_PLAFA|nr:hypothetical protein PFAG_00492 [Plasmodium falciparum Santa Lucia]